MTVQADLIDRITSRHIAKLLCRLGDTVAPVQISEIKRQLRFLAEDIRNVKTTTGESENEQQEENRGNC